MDREDPTNCRVMTAAEVVEEMRFEMRLHVGRVKMGRVTFAEAMERGLDMFAEKVARGLSHHIMFLKKPPIEQHGRFM